MLLFNMSPSMNQILYQRIREIENSIEHEKNIGDDAQLANIDLQIMLQKQQQTIQIVSNISKLLSETAIAVIRELRNPSTLGEINSLEQYILGDAYLTQLNDLSNYVEEMKKFIETKKVTIKTATGKESSRAMAFRPSEGMIKFMQRYISDPNFKSEMEKNPSMALKNSGLDISDGEVAFLSKIPGDELFQTFSNIPTITRLDVAMASTHGLNFISNEEFQPGPGTRKFMELYLSNPHFRNSFKNNPSQTVNTYHVQIKYDEVKQLVQVPIEKLEKEFSDIPNITRQDIIMAISEIMRSKTAVEGWPSKDMQQYMKRYVSDPSFRNAVLRNPESALIDAGFQINSEEATYLSNQTLEELEKSVPNTSRMDLPAIYDAVWTLNDSFASFMKEKELMDKMIVSFNQPSVSSSLPPQGVAEHAAVGSASTVGPIGLANAIGSIGSANVVGPVGSASAVGSLGSASAVGPIGSGSVAVAGGSDTIKGLLQNADTGASSIKTLYFGNPDKTWLLVVTNMVPSGGS